MQGQFSISRQPGKKRFFFSFLPYPIPAHPTVGAYNLRGIQGSLVPGSIYPKGAVRLPLYARGALKERERTSHYSLRPISDVPDAGVSYIYIRVGSNTAPLVHYDASNAAVH